MTSISRVILQLRAVADALDPYDPEEAIALLRAARALLDDAITAAAPVDSPGSNVIAHNGRVTRTRYTPL